MNDLIVGAWSNGASQLTKDLLASVRKRQEHGKPLMPYEAVIAELGDFLDSYDTITTELLTGEPVTA